MAEFHLKTPNEFDFKRTASWPDWIERFDRYREASGLSAKGGPQQVATLVYTMGGDAEKILKSFSLTEDEKKDYDTVRGKFDGHFVQRRNVIYETCVFRMRQQRADEPAEEFITALYALSEYCGFGDRREKEIMYQLIIGTRHGRLSKKMQLEDGITLEKAIRYLRQEELVSSQQTVVRNQSQPSPAPPPTASLEQVGTPTHRRPTQKRQQAPQRGSAKPSAAKCMRCGDSPGHPRAKCRASDAKCANCQKIGHYARVCLTKTVRDLNAATPTEAQATAFLGELGDDDDQPLEVTLDVQRTPITFKLDSGADVTSIPELLYQTSLSISLESKPLRVETATGTGMRVIGKFETTLRKNNAETRQQIYVIRGLKHPLLGRHALRALHLLKEMAEAESSEPIDIQKEFPNLFSGLGSFPGEYTIRLKKDATPFALSTPRRVAVPLMDAVCAELDSMEAAGVIFRVDEPTDWCSGMVLVPKSADRVRICVDLSKLNESVLRERVMLPSVEHTLAQLTGAKYFSTLDANSGFWQVRRNVVQDILCPS